jgi:hypothetical protein
MSSPSSRPRRQRGTAEPAHSARLQRPDDGRWALGGVGPEQAESAGMNGPTPVHRGPPRSQLIDVRGPGR